jgi:hypothetical protein
MFELLGARGSGLPAESAAAKPREPTKRREAGIR